MKRIALIMLIVILCFALTGCGSKNKANCEKTKGEAARLWREVSTIANARSGLVGAEGDFSLGTTEGREGARLGGEVAESAERGMTAMAAAAQKAYDTLKDHPDKTVAEYVGRAWEKTQEARVACEGIE